MYVIIFGAVCGAVFVTIFCVAILLAEKAFNYLKKTRNFPNKACWWTAATIVVIGLIIASFASASWFDNSWQELFGSLPDYKVKHRRSSAQSPGFLFELSASLSTLGGLWCLINYYQEKQDAQTCKQDELIPGNELPHILLPAGNSHSLSQGANSKNCIIKCWPNGICLRSYLPLARWRKLTLASGFILLSILINWLNPFLQIKPYSYFYWVTGVGIITTVCLYWPRAWVIFDRKQMVVHYLKKNFTIWGKAKTELRTWKWQAIRVEIVLIETSPLLLKHATETGIICAITPKAGNLHVNTRLPIGEFFPGNVPSDLIELWEHIRRFMRHEGPALAPGDSFFYERPYLRIGTALWFGQPLIGPGCLQYWNGKALYGLWFLTIPCGLACLPFIPFTLAAGLLRWLSHSIRREPEWPAEILANLGGSAMTSPSS